jgi:hypothetical protein
MLLETTHAASAAYQTGREAVRSRGVLEAVQATETVPAAIARSDSTWASVLDELRATREQGGILGDFAFDRYCDSTPAPFTSCG